MDTASDIAEFLTTRRARVTPEQAGLPTSGERRVPGLRREEVSSLAGVSVEYYKRLERGNLSGVSEGVLEGLAQGLRLDDAERAHLYNLARAANPIPPRRRRPVHQRDERMELSADAGLVIAVSDAEPGSRCREALNLLARWTSTPDPVETT